MKPLKVSKNFTKTMLSEADPEVRIAISVTHARSEARAEEWCYKLCAALEAHDGAKDLLREVLTALESGQPLAHDLSVRIRALLQNAGAD